MPKTWILNTVGTSLTKRGPASITRQQADDMLGQYFDELREYHQANSKLPSPPRPPCSELQVIIFRCEQWEGSCQGEQAQEKRTVHLSFFATKESEPSARIEIDFLNDQRPLLEELFPHLTLEKIDPQTDLKTSNINATNRTEFLNGISSLAENILEYLSSRPDPRDEILLNPTGGFKGLWAIWPLIFLRYPRVRILYSHDTSNDVYELPRFPVALDFGMFEELHSVLHQEGGVTKGFLNVVPEQVRDLFDQTGGPADPCLPNCYGEVIRQMYDKRDRALSGSGSILLEQIRSQELRRIIIERIPYWQNVWLGDQIPETVEHSKSHSLRLMEFAVEAIGEYPQLVDHIGGDGGLYLLFAAIWLHDIGHSNINYSVVSGDTSIDVPLDLFPSLVRDWHAYSSSGLMDSQEYLPSVKKGRDLVSLIAKYHRRSMPLVPKNEAEEEEELLPKHHGMLTEKAFSLWTEVNENLRRTRGNLLCELRSLQPDHVVAVEALLRFLDASDVQVARVSNPAYFRARSARTSSEVQILTERIKSLNGIVPSSEAQGLCRTVLGKLDSWNDSIHQQPIDANALMRIANEIDELEEHTLLRLVATVLGFDQPSAAQVRDGNYFLNVDALSLADRILFKTVQDIHFHKHASVSCCWYRAGEKGLRVYLKPEQANDVFPTYVAGDIYREVQTMGHILTDVLPFEGVFNALDDTRYQEPSNQQTF